VTVTGGSSGIGRATALEFADAGATVVVAEARPYRVEYHLCEDHSRLTDEDHVHYYPTDEGDDIETFDITESGVLTRR
jgi:NAD(P)-dependent dehydrogenase (short-subunit alcohol dehydrogenase family)